MVSGVSTWVGMQCERSICLAQNRTERTFEGAFEKAELEAERYAKENGFTAHDSQEAYEQDGQDLIDGHEVWSQLFEARLSLNNFYTERRERYEYSPEGHRSQE